MAGDLTSMHDAPRVRADCDHVPRPCPHDRCRYHLPGCPSACTLDEVARNPDGLSRSRVAEMLGICPELLRGLEAP